jgi:nitrogen fixation NifU-like protein
MHDANCHQEGYNPLCGDKITLHIYEQNGTIKKLQFEGSGCAISMASASLMTECLQGKTKKEFDEMFDLFHRLVTQGLLSEELKIKLGKLAVLSGVAEFPARVKCATLAWHTMNAVLHNNTGVISTEE